MQNASSLSVCICDELLVKLDSLAFKELFKNCCLYLTRSITAFQFQHKIKEHTKDRASRKALPSAKVFRLKLANSSYFSLSMKLFVLRLGKYKSVTVDVVKALAAEYGVLVQDAKRVFRLWITDSKFRSQVKQVAKPIPKDSPQWSEASLKEVFELMYPRLMKHAKYLARQKLRFVVLSTNTTYDDIVNDLMSHVWSRYFQVVPTQKSPLHMLNSLRLAITNEVNNLCDKHSTQKSGRLLNTGKDSHNHNTSMLLVVSENQLANIDDIDLDSLGSVDTTSGRDMRLSVTSVLQSQTDERKHRLLRIILGAVDLEFTEWLRNSGVASKVEDNEDVQVRLRPDAFNTLIAKFLRVPMDKVQNFLQQVGKQVAPEAYCDYTATAKSA